MHNLDLFYIHTWDKEQFRNTAVLTCLQLRFTNLQCFEVIQGYYNRSKKTEMLSFRQCKIIVQICVYNQIQDATSIDSESNRSIFAEFE